MTMYQLQDKKGRVISVSGNNTTAEKEQKQYAKLGKDYQIVVVEK